MKLDIVQGGAYGDEAKSKVISSLIKDEKYTHCLRFNGGSNAGHTFYLGDQKIITHLIPTGSMFKKKSIIGSGCVLNEKKFFEELSYLSKYVPDISNYVKVAYNTHIVQDKHIEEEVNENKIGTTKQGIGPAYRDKYSRVGLRAENVPSLKDFIIDTYEEFYKNKEDVYVLCEGAQALFLDIDFGEYPFVTSSHCGIGAVLNNGISHKDINQVICVEKCYETYVGSNKFQDYDDKALDYIGDVGAEFGATTGRRRQINYLNTNRLLKAYDLSRPDTIIFNKIDVLREVGIWKIIKDKKVIDLNSEHNFTNYLKNLLPKVDLIYSDNPYSI